MGAGEFAVVTTRIKREECKRTKHDSQFSKWQVLIGPSDWKDYSLGKDGAARYRIHNLPATASPGLYELGVAVSRTGLGRDVDKLDSDGVVAVYLGQADNVRSRLQCYGRTGAHLNNSNDRGLKNGPVCFEEIFSRGLSIVYRWVPMKNKEDALKTETQLLKKFDYAWNKGSNGTRRLDDVLQRHNKVASKNIQIPKPIRKLLYFSQKPVGIKIKDSKLLSQGEISSTYADEKSNNFFPQIFKFSKSQPRLVLDRHGADQDNICIPGVSLGDGSVCRRLPVEGRKEINESISMLTAEVRSQVDGAYSKPSISVLKECDGDGVQNFSFGSAKFPVVADKCPVSMGASHICGVVLDYGSLCRRQPVPGNKRCDEHKWRKTYGSNPKSAGKSEYLPSVFFDSDADDALNYKNNSSELYKSGRVFSRSAVNWRRDTICGVELSDGYFCTSQPVKGRVRCEKHKGFKVNEIKSKSAAKDKSLASNFSTFDDTKYNTSFCGAVTLSGSYCKNPVKGNTRCWQHSAHVSYTRSTISTYNDCYGGGGGGGGGTSVCGAPTRNGSYCKNRVKGGGTCWRH